MTSRIPLRSCEDVDTLQKSLPASISSTEHKIELLEQDVATSERTKGADFQMTVIGHKFGLDVDGKPQKQEAGEALLAAAQAFGKVYLNLQGNTTHNVELGTSVSGILTRIENAINGIPRRLEEVRGQLSKYHSQMKAVEEELQKKFPYAEELKEKSARLAQFYTELTMQERNQSPLQETPQPTPDVPEIEILEGPPRLENLFEIRANP
jgi:vacuolar-type H+-ATPase subunit I/STV1